MRPRAYPRLEHLKGASLGYATAFPTNITLGWKGLPATNSLAYYENLEIMAVKSFIAQAPGANVIKLFTALSYDFP